MKKQFLTLFSLALALGSQAQVISTFPYTQNFETEPQGPTACTSPYVMTVPGWLNVTGGADNVDWFPDKGGTPSSAGTGPTIDKNPGTATGIYMYVESSGSCGNPNKTAHLLSPYFNFTSLPAPWVSYGAHLRGINQGTLFVDATLGTTGVWTQVDMITGNQSATGTSWLERYIDLTAFTGLDSVRLRFRAQTGNGFNSDIAIDDVRVFDGPPCFSPSSVAASGVTDNQATISWTGTGTQYTVTWGTGTFTPPSANTVTATGTTQVLTGLSANTTYNVYVQNACANGTSSWIGPVSFTTLCGTNIIGDTDANPIIVNTPTYLTTGSTATCYTNNIGNAANDVFYRVDLDDCATEVDITLCGSSYDTYLFIYDASMNLLTSDDDGCPTSTASEIMDFAVTGGTSIYVVVDGFGSNNGNYTLSIIQAVPQPVADITYSGMFYCQNGTNPIPTIHATTGGVFSEATGNVQLDAATGEILLSNSNSGGYQIVYTAGQGTCTDADTVVVYIDPTDNADFSYVNNSQFCAGDAVTQMPTITGLGGGSFSATGGLSVSASTGAIDLSALPYGNYQVTYTTSGVCPTTNSVPVSYSNPVFGYTPVTVCSDDADVTASIGGTLGGVFSAGAGLSLNTNTGKISVANSTAGAYTISYSINGCVATDDLTIIQRDDASFTYGQTSFCTNGTYPVPTILGTPGGAFSSTSGIPVNISDGAIFLDISTVGSHSVTYGTTGACPDYSIVHFTINPADTADFAYDSTAYCLTDTINPVPTITGFPGGFFSVADTGIVIDTVTGEIDLAASVSGNYMVSYTTTGICPETATFAVFLDACMGSGVADLTNTSKPSFQLYPNPNYGDFVLEMNNSNSQTATIQIINALGQTLQEQTVLFAAGEAFALQLQQATAGSYFVRVITADGNRSTFKMTIIE